MHGGVRGRGRKGAREQCADAGLGDDAELAASLGKLCTKIARATTRLALADGSVKFINYAAGTTAVIAMSTRAGGEVISQDEL